MENKKDLAKIALTALILASALPVDGKASIEAEETVLTAGCGAHGCPSVKSSSGGPYYHPNTSSQSDTADQRRSVGSSSVDQENYQKSRFNADEDRTSTNDRESNREE